MFCSIETHGERTERSLTPGVCTWPARINLTFEVGLCGTAISLEPVFCIIYSLVGVRLQICGWSNPFKGLSRTGRTRASEDSPAPIACIWSAEKRHDLLHVQIRFGDLHLGWWFVQKWVLKLSRRACCVRRACMLLPARTVFKMHRIPFSILIACTGLFGLFTSATL